MPIPTQEAIQAQQPQDGSGVATYEGPNWRTLGLAGQLTEKTGGEMQAAAASQQQLNAKQDEYMAQDAANKLKAAAVGLEVDPETGYMSKKGGDVVGPKFRDQYTQQFQQQQQEIASKLENDNQRKAFELHSAVIGNDFTARLLQHQSEQTYQFNNQVNLTTIGAASKAILAHPFDDDADGTNSTYDTNLGLIEHAYRNMAQDQGITGDTQVNWVSNKMTAVREQLMSGRIESVMQADPHEAQQMYARALKNGDLMPGGQIGEKVKKAADASQIETGAVSNYHATIANNLHNGGPTAQDMYGGNQNAAKNLGADYVKPYQDADVAKVANFVASSSPYDASIQKSAQANNVDPSLIKLFIGLENHGAPNPTAVNATSGARGLGQIMPKNEASLGITDWKDPDQQIEGIARLLKQSGMTVGTDYTQAAKVYYGGPNQQNWGPNTQQYAENARAVTAALHGGVLPQSGPATADQLVGMTGTVRANAERQAAIERPYDPEYQKAYVARVMSEHEHTIQDLKGAQVAATQTVFSAFTNPDQTPRSLNDFTPDQRKAYDSLEPQTQHEFLGMLNRGAKQDVPENEANTKETFRLMGLAQNDPVAFKNIDIAHEINNGTFTKEQQRLIGNTYMAIDKKTAVGASVDKWLKSPSVQGWMRTAGLLPQTGGDKPNTVEMQDDYNTFTGRFQKTLSDYVDTNKALPKDEDALDMARKLTANYAVPSSHWWGTTNTPTPGYKLDDQETAPVVPPADRARLSPQFEKVYGTKPTEAQLSQVYLADTLHPNDKQYRDAVHQSILQEIQKQKAPPPPSPTAVKDKKEIDRFKVANLQQGG